MALNLGLEGLAAKQEETPIVSTEQLLQSQIDFNEAYQAFVDYKNVCEIVVKAKASNESMTFASNLLNASVENIEVSVETLGEKFTNAWKKFVDMWKNFLNWVKRAFNLFWNSITKKKDGTFSIEPNLGSAELEEIVSWMDELLKTSKGTGSNSTSTASAGLDHTMKRGGSSKLTTHAEVKAWCKLAKEAIVKVDKAVAAASKSYATNDKYYQTRKANANEGEDVKKKAADVRDRMAAAKTLMRVGPRVVRGITATIKQVNAEYKEVKSR